jgi:hypothetical protein
MERRYVVHVIRDGKTHSYKLFAKGNDALLFAREEVEYYGAERADLHSSEALSDRDAIHDVMAGGGTIITSKMRAVTKAEMSKNFRKAYTDAARKNDKAAIAELLSGIPNAHRS